VAFWKQAARVGQPPTIIFATVSERDRDELAGVAKGRGYTSADRAAVGIRWAALGCGHQVGCTRLTSAAMPFHCADISGNALPLW
jgi:hypothetical protein